MRKKVSTSNAKNGMILDKGKRHYDENGKPIGGIKAIVTNDGNKPVELEVDEVIISRKAVKNPKKYKVEGTTKEILSVLNQEGGGVPIGESDAEIIDKFENGGLINKDELYKEWSSLVNMTKTELQKFYNSPEGKAAGLTASEANKQGIDSGRESARWIIRMKDTPVSQWSNKMWEWCKKQINFIKRMSGMKGALYDKNGNKTRKHTALLIWGHNPEEKFEKGGDMKEESIPDLIEGLKVLSESFTGKEKKEINELIEGLELLVEKPEPEKPKEEKIFASFTDKSDGTVYTAQNDSKGRPTVFVSKKNGEVYNEYELGLDTPETAIYMAKLNAGIISEDDPEAFFMSREDRFEHGGEVVSNDDKYQEIVDKIEAAIKKLNLPYLDDVDYENTYKLSKSKNDFGQSWYMIFKQQNIPIEIRISDHSVTSSSRILDEKYLAMINVYKPFSESDAEILAKNLDKYFKLRFEKAKLRKDAFEKDNEKRAYKKEKLENFLSKLKRENKSLGKIERTYQTPEEIIDKHPDWEYVYTYPSQGAFTVFYVKNSDGVNINLSSGFISDEYFDFLIDIGEVDAENLIKKVPYVKPALTVTQIANLHNVKVKDIVSQLKIGEKIELEHTNDQALATKIALQHLEESPVYYTKLEEMEKSFESGGEIEIDHISEIPDYYERLEEMEKPKTVKEHLLNDNDNENDFIVEGTRVISNDGEFSQSWEVVSLSAEGLTLKHIPKSILSVSLDNKYISYPELKEMYSNGLISINGIYNLSALNVCVKAIQNCLDKMKLMERGGELKMKSGGNIEFKPITVPL